MDKLKPFVEFLESFETESMRLYCEDMIQRMPNYTFTMASSTSGKYHNPSQLTAGGQLKHVLQCLETLNYILNLEYIQEKIPQKKKRDCMRVAMCLHDSQKCGDGSYTVHEHPLLAAEWVRTTKVQHDIKQGLKDYIAALISSHSGQWVSSPRSNIELPKPMNDEEFIIHLCDYLSSRKNIEMAFTEEQLATIREVAVPEPENFFFTNGKYKDMNWYLVYEMDKDYLYWLRDKAGFPIQQPLKTYLEELLP